ncbi:helix-turn-helix transcriptional regulator [Carboxydothermus ferrireducens]|uniref:DNA-binding transcriptional regulator YafY n=1 Tax=Carboxydothermus ferrireducens DSM 11255 TaxID=1119529 RepID=A0ABX2RDZ5_9THEO|nr:WYL domain-containing protein [Carboxydothermus ferrireducens]NYE58837.1 putative DNA-binding transcriptional regulator YafY [Carboxydothermus ferrireducens DSM 11255]
MNSREFAELIKVLNFHAAMEEISLEDAALLLAVTKDSLRSFLNEVSTHEFLNEFGGIFIDGEGENEVVICEGYGLKIPVLQLSSEEKTLIVQETGDVGEKLLKIFAQKIHKGEKDWVTKTAKTYTHKRIPGVTISPEQQEMMQKIETAIYEKLKIKITYAIPEENKNNTVVFNPAGLVYYKHDGFWYLVGFEEQKLIKPEIIRIDHITSVLFEQKKAEIPEGFQIENFFKNRWGMDTGEEVKVKICFLPEANVIDKAQRELKARGFRGLKFLEDGSLLWEDRVAGVSDLLFWLRSFGSSVEVIEPRELRQEMVENIKRLMEFYEVK